MPKFIVVLWKIPQYALIFVWQESWQLRKGSSVLTDEAEYEEELYVAGHMVIWSRGTKSQASYVYKAFTVDSPVQQVSVPYYGWGKKWGNT